ncbi:MAG: sulfide/dihydroorotate dehydrogenase-like FAD/NAD-binding protein [Oscillospiraceae bacterium]|nr:sulfide/dihydroorotate dehydrogenase-like FAD/NAD-binding protein [Oscillospiraceae bacterium]MCI8807692.1 sulfide/dihydroorotate dehydrogenase-like FAD/NAD-binding protein [Oscillospiraceae bacterium]MCI9549252.1 sulfide/dihydroorotate dehydrogenase-like FAD/NAD-binding protein [Oscillospiraceae bacterium]
MYRIVKKRVLNPTVSLMEVEAPAVARKAEPGQFIILRVDEEGERIPLTIADFDRERGTVTIIYQVVGATTEKLNHKREGESLQDFVGPLGRATETEGLKRVAVVGGGVGTAIAYPVAKKLHDVGCHVDLIVGFRSKDLVILEEEFKAASTQLIIGTDDGSYGKKALVTDLLREQIEGGAKYDRVIAIGPVIMMKFVCELTKQYDIPTVVSMNPIMIDGTGMCGGCRLSVGGETKFACVDGPEFDGHKVDFDEAMARGAMYKDFERHAYEEACNLFQQEVK